MPVLQYFKWVGSFLFAALLIANRCVPAPIASASHSDVPLDQKIHIRIHTDHKWPERVVFDTTPTTLAQNGDVEVRVGGSETTILAERQPIDARAEMAAIAVRPCFRPPCAANRPAASKISPIAKDQPVYDRVRLAARKDLTFPNRLHKPPGRS